VQIIKKLYSLLIFSMFLMVSCKPKDEVQANGNEAYDFQSPILYGKAKYLSADNPLTVAGVDLGRHLFYDKMLSIDSTVACASCHIQKFGFSDSAKFSHGIAGGITNRNSMAIANTAWQNIFFWDGRAKTLEQQALLPIANPKEMNMNINELLKRLNVNSFYVEKFKCAFPNEGITSNTLAKAIAQFEQTMVSANSRYDQYKLGKIQATEQEKRGERLFFTHPDAASGLRGGNCGDCHSGTLTFSNAFSNNGLDSNPTDFGLEGVTGNANDRAKFKIPSLRNIELTAPYMHDGRFSTLEEVLDHYNEHIQPSSTLDPQITSASNNPVPFHTTLGLTAQEKEDIIVFLKMLTDKSFTEDKRFSNPFVE
jgi:cytochrome c peroxidase